MSLDPAREKRNREVMRTYRLDALVCRLPENVLLLTGYWPLSSFAFVVFPREGSSSLIALDTEISAIPEGAVDEVRAFRWGVLGASDPYPAVERHLREVMRSAGVDRGRIGYEGSFEAVAPGHGAGERLLPSAITHATIGAAAPDATLVDATSALHVARARKTPIEIARLRRANAVAAFGLEAFALLYEAGRREAKVEG